VQVVWITFMVFYGAFTTVLINHNCMEKSGHLKIFSFLFHERKREHTLTYNNMSE